MEFQITPAPSGATIVLVLLTVLFAVMTLGFGWLTVSATRPSVVLDGSSMTLRAPLYGRSIDLSHIRLDEARVVNLDASADLKPKGRTNGIGLPGLGIGWFKLASGEKALVAITARDRVLHLPTDQGYSLLLSLERPEAFLERARRSGGGA